MRRATVLATAVLAMGALAVPAMAVAPDDVPQGAAAVDRIAGDTRYDTAAQTALRAYPNGAETVLVATGEKFPDALAASYLAGGVDAPIVLVRPDEIPSYTADALNELAPTNLVVLGLENAISAQTYDELGNLEGVDTISRIGGDTRRETAAMLAAQGGEVGTMRDLSEDTDGEYKTAVVARADAFPDALASGPLALEGRHPILLTDHGELPSATIAALTDADLGIQQVILTGGPVAISAEVEAEIEGLDTIENVQRVAGGIRTETAVMLGELTRTELGWDSTNISLARGDNFPDALTLAPLAAQTQASLFLSRNPQTIEGHTFAGIQDLACTDAGVDNLLITGGPVAITDDAQGEAMLATICADYTFPISWEQETESGKEGAEGTGWVTVEGDTICTVYDVGGLEGEANASHIHEAPEGEDGDIVLDLGAPNAEGFLATCETGQAELAGEITLNPENYYVNIHTPDFPLGAARGQLPADETPQEFEENARVFGDAVTDAAGTGIDDLRGTAAISTNEQGQVCLDLTFENLANDVTVARAVIHEGAADQDAEGEPLATFEDPTSGTVCSDDATVLDLLLASNEPLYLSVTDDGGAEIARGQLESTHDAELTAAGSATVEGAAFLYEAATANTICTAVALDTEPFADGNITVSNADGSATVATFAVVEADGQVFFDCVAVDDADTEPELITVPTQDGDLTGDLTEDPPAA